MILACTFIKYLPLKFRECRGNKSMPPPSHHLPKLLTHVYYFISRIKLRRSNTLGRYDRPTLRPNSVAGDSPTSSGASGLLSSFSINSSSPTLNVCLECKQAVESMMMSQVESFQQRRRMTYHESKSRRNVVTKSLILD